ncbi:MAG: TolC family protein [Acidobacteria bacterium]|nr:TolC family protein [Acidobacteriota bacterium]
MTTRIAAVALATSLALQTAIHGQAARAEQPDVSASRYVDPTGGLSLDQAVARALEQEPGLRAARAAVDAARGVALQAGLRPNPTVSVAQQQEPFGMDRQTSVEVMWPLDLFRRRGRVEVADRQVDAAVHEVADRERLLGADVRTAYGAVAAAVRELSVLDDLVAVASRQQVLVGARVEQGATPPLDRDLLEVELRRFESDRLRQAGAVEDAVIELKRLLGMSAGAPLAIRDDLEQLVRAEAAAALPPAGAAEVNGRPDILAAAAAVQAAEAGVDRARRDGRVDASLFGNYMRMQSGFPQRAFDAAGAIVPIEARFNYVVAGLSIAVPVRDRSQGIVAAAQAERRAASARLDAAHLAAQAEIFAARVRDERGRQAAAIYTSGALDLARHNLGVVQQTYELGRATVFDVLAEQRRYLEVERSAIDSLREAYEARQALRRALGEVR